MFIEGSSLERASDDAIEQWRRDGAVVLKGFFTADEMAPVQEDFRTLHPSPFGTAAGGPANFSRRIGEIHRDQYKNILTFPFGDGSAETSLLVVHPALIDLARRALGGPDVALSFAHTWAKYGDEPTDYSQPFHLDYVRDSLLVPSEDARFRTLSIMIYVTDVAEGNGALSFVPLPSSPQVSRFNPMPTDEEQRDLYSHARSAVGPAGSVLIFRNDVFHRGTGIVEADAHRHVIMSNWRPADFPIIQEERLHGTAATNVPGWQKFFSAASPEQLEVIGVPRPGHPYWTEQTIQGVNARYPGWNAEPYRTGLLHAD